MHPGNSTGDIRHSIMLTAHNQGRSFGQKGARALQGSRTCKGQRFRTGSTKRTKGGSGVEKPRIRTRMRGRARAHRHRIIHRGALLIAEGQNPKPWQPKGGKTSLQPNTFPKKRTCKLRRPWKRQGHAWKGQNSKSCTGSTSTLCTEDINTLMELYRSCIHTGTSHRRLQYRGGIGHRSVFAEGAFPSRLPQKTCPPTCQPGPAKAALGHCLGSARGVTTTKLVLGKVLVVVFLDGSPCQKISPFRRERVPKRTKGSTPAGTGSASIWTPFPKPGFQVRIGGDFGLSVRVRSGTTALPRSSGTRR